MISIVIPTIGSVRQEYFKATIDSAVGLGSVCTEILIVDNSQNPAWQEFMTSAVPKDKRIAFKTVPARLNMAESWNSGLQAATGTWVLFLHDDDFLNNPGLDRVPKTLFAENVGMLSFDYTLLEGDKRMPRPRSSGIDGILKDNPKFASTLFHREKSLSLGGFDFSHGHFLDFVFFLRMAKKHGIHHTPIDVGTYRIHGENASSLEKRAAGYGNSLPAVLKDVFELFPEKSLREQILYHTISFTYPNLSLKARFIRLFAKSLGKKAWVVGRE